MDQDTFKRKLTTIFSADAVGYSKLMETDEEATVKAITTYQKVMAELILQHRGRVIDSPGDNLLAEFSSVVDAVQCAVATQKELQARNDDLSEDRRMAFRIGINLGDVIQEDDRIYGDGVNIAARLEGLAEPGGICISKTAFDQISTKLPYGYDFIGEQTVKNIKKPVGAYRVSLEPRISEEGKTNQAQNKFLERTPVRIALLGVLVIVAALWIWPLPWQQPSEELTSEEDMAYPLPDMPSIAVLPFDNMSDDPQQEYFSDGITEDIITALSKTPKIFVIARNSTFAYKGKSVNVQEVGQKLGVRYVLEGSVRKSGDKVRITAQLIDAQTGHHLWADRYDRNLNEIFVVQDELTKNIITALQIKLTEGEKGRVAAKGTNNLEAYLKYLQAMNQVRRFNIESNELGRELAQEAITLDPEYAMPYRVLSMSYQMDVWLGTSKSPNQSLNKAMELMQKAIELDENYAEAHGHLGFIYTMLGEHEKAIAKAEEAITINPNSAYAHHVLGQILRFAGRHDEAIPEYKKALRLNPIPPTNYLFGLGKSYYYTGQEDEGINWCEKAVRQDPDSFLAHLLMTELYSLAGRDEAARGEAAEVLRINPKFSVEKWEKAVTSKNKEEKKQMMAALRKAGLPD